jgi:hypothetical protein
MTRLNLIDASLLDVSGELGPTARKRLHAHLAKKPAARAKYNAIKTQFARLSAVPRPDLSQAHQHRIAANIKSAIHQRLASDAREKQALRRAKLVHYALAGLSAAAAAVVIVAGISMMNTAAETRRAAESVAHLNRVIDRLAATDSREASYDQALADVESSIRQLQAENNSMAGLQTNEMTPLLDALASLPAAPAGADPAVDQLELPQGGL